MFRVVLEEVGSGVKPCDLTTPLYSIVHIPLIMLVYSTSAWNFPVGSRYIGNPGGICEGQAISQHSKPRTK